MECVHYISDENPEKTAEYMIALVKIKLQNDVKNKVRIKKD